MGAYFGGGGIFARGRLAWLVAAAAGAGLFCLAAEEEPPPEVARPRPPEPFPAFREVARGNAPLRDPFGASAPAARSPAPARPKPPDEAKARAEGKREKKEAAVRLVGVARKGARCAAVFVCGGETSVCAEGGRVGPYRVVSLEAGGAVLEGPGGLRRLQVGR